MGRWTPLGGLVWVGRWTPLGRPLWVDGWRQRVVVDLHLLDEVRGQGRRVGHDGGHRLAGVPDLVTSQQGVRRVRELRALHRLDRERPSVQRGGGQGSGATDRDDAGVRVGAAHERDVGEPWEVDVVQEAARAAHEPLVLAPREGAPDEPRHPSCSRSQSAASGRALYGMFAHTWLPSSNRRTCRAGTPPRLARSAPTGSAGRACR